MLSYVSNIGSESSVKTNLKLVQPFIKSVSARVQMSSTSVFAI